MEAIALKAFEMMERDGSVVALILQAVLVVHAWLVRADAGIARSLINSERRRLEHLLYLDNGKDGAGTSLNASCASAASLEANTPV